MTTTITCATNPGSDVGGGVTYYSSIATTDVFVITLSDGTQFAISGYDDKESADLAVSAPQDDKINLHMNNASANGTFVLYAYSGGTLGAALYTFTATGADTDPGFQILYNAATQQLAVSMEPTAGFLDTSGIGEFIDPFSGSSVYGGPVCFLRGTLILTARGEVPVESLRAGDLVVSKFGGLRPVRWIGLQAFEGRLAGSSHQPIRLAKGSLGAGIPSCDLFVSPGHAVLVPGETGNVLVHAGALVNGSTITQERVRGLIEYFHIDLGPHDCVLANGAWAESYFEDRNRDAFHNAADFHARFPGHEPVRQATCLPIVTGESPLIDTLRARLAPQAVPLAA